MPDQVFALTSAVSMWRSTDKSPSPLEQRKDAQPSQATAMVRMREQMRERES